MQTPVRAPKPDPKHVSIGQGEQGWSIELDSNATVIELAMLMTAFRCRAEMITENCLILSPMESGTVPPTGEQVRDLFEHGERWMKRRIGPIRIAPSIPTPIAVDVNLVCNCGAPGGYPHEPDCTWWERRS